MRRNERALGVAALIVGSGVVAVVAAGGRRWAPATRQPGHSRVVVITVLVLLVAVLLARAVRAARKTRLRPERIPRAALVLLAALLAAALVSMTFVHLGRPPRHGPGASAGKFGRVGDGVRAPGVGVERRKAGGQRSSHVYWIAGSGGLAIVVGAVATVYWLRRRRRQESGVEEDDETAAQLIGTVLEESIDELRRESDARRVVIACYARMERALATVGLDRAPSEAPLEYLERVLLGFRATDEAVQRLTALFEEAKFSDHVVNERMREAAISSLSALRREVSTRPSMATA